MARGVAFHDRLEDVGVAILRSRRSAFFASRRYTVVWTVV